MATPTPAPAMTNEQLAQQIKGYGDQMTQLQSMFNSGNVTMAGDDGYGRISGGMNQYGSRRPDTILMRDQDGNLDSRLTQTMSPEIQALRDKAMAPGDTVAAQIARQQLGANMSGARDNLQTQGASALQGGMRNLAMRGGASSGARERMNRDIGRGLMAGQQNLGRQEAMANLQITGARCPTNNPSHF